MLTFGKETATEAEAIDGAVARAVSRRDPALCGETDGLRLINAEGDALPGVIADRYGDTLVVRITSAGMDRARPLVVRALRTRAR